ncbi:TM0106 family RecB-like putative nuclease [Cryobacterium sp. BB307]|uniref:TM0106 family RecB-like putative nuclease n=1 Tax=Cryobacterium sp. BB307 TaxID=2716317 RepID=UPI0014451BE1
MFVLDDRVVTSPSDLTVASKCEFAFLRKIDAKLGRVEPVEDPEDAMLERAARLGDQHEARVLERYRERFGSGVVEIARPDELTAETLAAATAATHDAFENGADVVFQATFFDGDLIGFADFIVRQPDGSYLVQDTKLARRARVTALLQLAAYVEQLEKTGIRAAPTVELLLGDGTVSVHQVADIMPVYRRRRERLVQLVADRMRASDPVAWGDPRFTVDGRCPTCDAEVTAHRDVLLVAGMRVLQRERLANAGITTIDQLAGADTVPETIAASTFESLRAQARLQLQATDDAPPPFELADGRTIGFIPEPNPGDVFFDFEGDPLYTEGPGESWGIDYLWGLVEADGTFRAWWAHNFTEERAALEDFMAYIADRRKRYPGMHIYHYASYERTHLLSIAARHGVCENAVDGLLRDHMLVDLYPIVRKGVRVGSRSYSIKKLEPLYMPDTRDGQAVTTGADSITEYVSARELIDSGDLLTGQQMLDAIADYNEYDCQSTLALRDWLLAVGAEHGIRPGSRPIEEQEGPDVPASPLAEALLHRAGDPLHERTVDQTAAALASAAIDYHRREQKSFWWGHFARLVAPIEEWEATRDVLRAQAVRVVDNWHRGDNHRVDRRTLLLRGEWAPGSTVKPTEQAGPFLVYESPGPFIIPNAEAGARPARSVRLVEVYDDGALVEETLPEGIEPYAHLPVALTPAAPPGAGAQRPAIEEWAQRIIDTPPDGASGGWPKDPMVDILRRTPPRTRSGNLSPVVDESYRTAVVASLLDLDDSYLAVQGPPGTGKTWLASHVIADLVREHHWKIGVVAQSHAVVEHVLDRLVGDAGLDPSLVAKAPKDRLNPGDHDYTVLAKKDDAFRFAFEHADTGFVFGGTAWDFANVGRVPRRSLDLIVVDEAGQFALASTIAASVAAKNVMLLGDPQQLPQVSQGTHPEPVDTSALGWVADGHDVLPPEYGYFLAESRRMHPAVAAPVSRLSYEGALHSHECASQRSLDGIAAGLHPVPVVHVGNSTQSPEEAEVVVELVRAALGRSWVPEPDAAVRPLRQADLIVVTPYNAQLTLVRAHLDAAGFTEVPVGTVDKFQGQEAAVAIVTLAASSASDVPRGMEFLIMKNRLNVAISRAQWAAYLIYSPELTEYLPHTPDGVTELAAFIRLVENPAALPVA